MSNMESTLSLFDSWRRWYTGWAEAFCTLACLYISLPFQPGDLPVCVLPLRCVFAFCVQDTVVQANFIADGGFHKFLSVSVTTFAVFLSWMYLLGGDDNCMLSVPSSTCDPRTCCWQSGEICHAIADAAFTLFNYALWSSINCGWSLSCPDLLSCQRVTCSTIPVLSAWHCVLPLLSVVATRFPSRKPCVFLLLFFLDGFCTWWQVITDSRQPSRIVSSCVVEMWGPWFM